ncbi:PREDICTED: uncharacterized protein LOC104707218 [Camelina sativa]|uniref:Uncharacterized protein LOC104707218 n=1 Tax=Camelina sativa TaxID=90675 RepID=A0ABM0T6Z9_CAMSA|nr:PREDICTED: uncharacterized protein LOC104707218 [Camelina sativa]XP_010421824.1 PREDICTED: uncharacterized protein LOC104707218 [Camelina sativa]
MLETRSCTVEATKKKEPLKEDPEEIPVEERVSRLEELVADQHSETMKHMADLFEVMKRSTANKTSQAQTNQFPVILGLRHRLTFNRNFQIHDTMEDRKWKELAKILERKMVNRQGRAVTKVLVQWLHEPEEEATWEFLFDLQKRFQEFDA